MRIVLREVLTRCDLRKASPLPEKTGRRNITLSPKAGTPVVVTARRPAREPAARRCLARLPLRKIHFQRVTRETFCLRLSPSWRR